ncbi:MAG: conjugal transfer protein TraC, partial [Candidatus Nealsonbacteria bacterium CG08_land_8_20_14_0_20_36_22]
DLSSNEGIFYGINTHNDSLVLFDRFTLANANEVIFATSGAGKSYAVKLEILRYLMLGVDSIIIDPENEYKFLAEAVGGSFFNISLSSSHHINPFDLPPPREDEKPEDVLRTNIINLVGLMRIMLGGLSPEEDGIMDRALTETYAAKDITLDSDPKKWGKELPFPLMSDLESVLSTMEGAESLVKRLQRFTKGVYSQFFNQPSNIDVKNRLVVFGIRDMEDELRPMALFIILRYIWKTITSELKKRLLIVDEAWWLMKNEDGASFLFGTVKRARKYWLGVTTITQDVNDFMKSEYGKPIITNSSLALLMKQSPATINVVQQTFNLTEEEKMLLLESPVGEGIFFAGTKHVLIKVLASYTEDQIITTAPEEIQKIKQAKREIGE